MRKMPLFAISLILLLNVGLVGAITQQEISEAKTLIDSKAECKSLSDIQLETIGEYYMEQMHSGESHELMHKMMGLKEGSEEEKQFHISMAKRLYCDEAIDGMGGGMMNMMMGYGMMGSWGYGFGYWSIINILYAVLLIGLIILVYLWIMKLWKNMKSRGGKR